AGLEGMGLGRALRNQPAAPVDQPQLPRDGDALDTMMVQVDLDKEPAPGDIRLALKPNRGLAHRRDAEDNSPTRVAKHGRSIERPVIPLDEATIGMGAISVVEADEVPKAASVLSDPEDDAIAVRAARVGRSVEG